VHLSVGMSESHRKVACRIGLRHEEEFLSVEHHKGLRRGHLAAPPRLHLQDHPFADHLQQLGPPREITGEMLQVKVAVDRLRCTWKRCEGGLKRVDRVVPPVELY